MADFFQGVLNMSWKKAGWKETYPLVGDSYSAVQPRLAQIMYHRRAFMGQDVQIDWAHISRVGTKRDSIGLVADWPLGPDQRVGPTVGLINDINSAIVMRFQSFGGRWAQRYFNGYPDDWVVGGRLADLEPFTMPTSDAAIVTLPNVNASLLQIQQSFWRYLKANTVNFGKYVRSADPAITTATWDQIVFLKIGRRIRGRPLGMSAGRRKSNLIA